MLKTLSETIYTGWPDDIQQLPSEVREYWSYRDELTLQNRRILKGHQVVIPEQLRRNILQQLHTSHQGIDKTKKLVRESIYWPCVNKSIENICASCWLFQEMQPQQTPQHIQQHERPLALCVRVGTDIFTIHNDNYLIISDYYSQYPFIKKLPSLNNASATIPATNVFQPSGYSA